MVLLLKTLKETFDNFKKKVDDIMAKRKKDFDEVLERKELFSKKNIMNKTYYKYAARPVYSEEKPSLALVCDECRKR